MSNCKCDNCETQQHDSDCAVHNEPATPNGDCDCKPVKFAKLFEDDELGQILVFNGENDEGNPEVRFTFIPPGVGPCSVAINFGADQWEKADEYLDKVDLEAAKEVVQEVAGLIETGPDGCEVVE